MAAAIFILTMIGLASAFFELTLGSLSGASRTGVAREDKETVQLSGHAATEVEVGAVK
ncbi:hypothetical protein [Sinosporangium siamense]|uniref:Uncharacterized protein n=1 Tax=Sinosporangium siamense TaxID=1367973 RepID=A0A919VCK6_9ACTN|nr:hypothetical protein [Sinosporangium siamense]GII93229.1 hypothetical protein Ssi02_34600 [Sinosporangium siamense]